MQKRKILITNDDGIAAEGLVRLAEAAREFGEVWVVAPDGERSAASHSISLRKAVDVRPETFPVKGVRAFSCSGLPGDCVRVGMLSIMPEKPDVVLSGINYGCNVGSDIQYSATAGAAFEAVFQGCRGIAVSERARVCHETTDHYLREILERWIDHDPGPGRIVNVNFPGVPLAECGGVLEGRSVSRGMFFRDHYEEVEKLPGGGVRLMVKGERDEKSEEGSDLRAIVEKYVSVGIVNNIGF